jgi:hypothetical protein
MTPILLLSRDLLFITKIREAATSVGKEVAVLKTEAGLREVVDTGVSGGVLLIDLEKPGVAISSIAPLWESLMSRGWQCLSFFSHVHEELAAEAVTLRLGEVLPRSRFIRVLPDILRSL